MGATDPSPTRPPGIARGLGAVTSNKMRSVIGAIESAGIPEVDYAKLLALFEGKHSKILVSRHAAAITRVCRVHERGFPLRDLPQLCKLFRFAYDQVAAGKAKRGQQNLLSGSGDGSSASGGSRPAANHPFLMYAGGKPEAPASMQMAEFEKGYSSW